MRPRRSAQAATALAGGAATPTEEQIQAAAEQLARDAVTPFLKARFRRRILEIRTQNEQTIDRHSIDEVLYSGFDASAVDKAQSKVTDFRGMDCGTQGRTHSPAGSLCWNTASAALPPRPSPTERGTGRLRLSLRRQLSFGGHFRPSRADKVVGTGGSQLADLVNLVRHALIPTLTLVPYADELRARYQAWLKERDAETAFTTEQREWLDRMAEHIATSLSIEPDDFEDGWFGQHGSLGRAHALFGDQLTPLLTELNERLAA